MMKVTEYDIELSDEDQKILDKAYRILKNITHKMEEHKCEYFAGGYAEECPIVIDYDELIDTKEVLHDISQENFRKIY